MIVTGGHVGTHVDALAHVSQDGLVTAGSTPPTDPVPPRPSLALGIDTFEPYVGRGVLLDVAGSRRRRARPRATGSRPTTSRPPPSGRRRGPRGRRRAGRHRLVAPVGRPPRLPRPATACPGPACRPPNGSPSQQVRVAGAETIAFEQSRPAPATRAAGAPDAAGRGRHQHHRDMRLSSCSTPALRVPVRARPAARSSARPARPIRPLARPARDAARLTHAVERSPTFARRLPRRGAARRRSAQDVPGRVLDMLGHRASPRRATRRRADRPCCASCRGWGGTAEATVDRRRRPAARPDGRAGQRHPGALARLRRHPPAVGAAPVRLASCPPRWPSPRRSARPAPALVAAVAAGIEVTDRLGMAAYDPAIAQSSSSRRAGTPPRSAARSARPRPPRCCSAWTPPASRTRMGIAASMGAGVIEANRTGGTVKRVHCGWAAHAGVLAGAAGRATGSPVRRPSWRAGSASSTRSSAARCDADARPRRARRALGAAAHLLQAVPVQPLHPPRHRRALALRAARRSTRATSPRSSSAAPAPTAAHHRRAARREDPPPQRRTTRSSAARTPSRRRCSAAAASASTSTTSPDAFTDPARWRWPRRSVVVDERATGSSRTRSPRSFGSAPAGPSTSTGSTRPWAAPRRRCPPWTWPASSASTPPGSWAPPTPTPSPAGPPPWPPCPTWRRC